MKRIVSMLALCLAAAPARAAFPPDQEFLPLVCDRAPVGDAFQDTPGFFGERDIVGNATTPAALRAADDQNLYLRIRLDADAAPGGTLTTSTWGWEFDLDGDLTNYEVLVLVDGMAAGGQVNVFANTAITVTNSPTDPADAPPAASFTFAANARSVPVFDGSQFGGNGDFFLDFQVPWSALVPLGLDRDTATVAWVASSDLRDALDGDFACHDGGSGAATLDGSAGSDPTTGDPTRDPNPPPPPGGIELEGGGGCAATRNGACPLLVLGALLAACGRRRHTQRSRTGSRDRARRFL